MADGNGGCCIARWGGGGHVAAASASYNTSKMDMIMLKFRPIAPKPVPGSTSASEGSGRGGSGRQVKAGGRGRKKAYTKDNNNSSGSSTRRCNNNINNNNNGRKRKSSSPDRRCDLDLVINERDDLKTDPTLLPLFPEAPDLSPGSDQVHNSHVPFSLLNFDSFSSSPTSEGNYNNCHHYQVSWW